MEKEHTILSFDSTSLDAETRAFVQQKTDEIHGQLKRTAEGVIRIGQNLLDVKKRLGHGHFLAWVTDEFHMSEQSARNFLHVAQKFGERTTMIVDLPMNVLYELAAPSTHETIVEGVLSGDIPPTLQAVREAKKAEQQALADKEALQHLLQQERSATHIQIMELTVEIELLQQEMPPLSQPQIKEVPIVPEEMTQQMNVLRSRVQTLTHQRDTLSKRVEELGGQVQAMSVKREEINEARRLCLAWQETTRTFQGAVLKVLSRWPSPLDAQVFEATEWNQLEQLKVQCHRMIEACECLREDVVGSIVDADDGPR